MPRLFVFGFFVLLVIELGLFAGISQLVGLWPALAGIFVLSLLGMIVVREQGLSLIANLRGAMQQGQLPARTLADGMLTGIAGAMMIVPGYLTGLTGLLLLIPPVRDALRRFLGRRFGLTAFDVRSTSGRTDGPRVIELDDEDFRQR